MSAEPRGSRANIPEYGITDTPYDVKWSDIAAKIEASRNYWVSTTRADGRPHAMPVWGVWVNGALYFSTGASSVKGRNLARSPEVVVHLESGDDVVVLEGVVVRPETAEFAGYVDAYEAKYSFRPDPSGTDPTYRVQPRAAHTWLEADFPNSAMRWEFD
jgi:hypothetical protein